MADESYYWYKSHGICVKCKKNNASPNRIKVPVEWRERGYLCVHASTQKEAAKVAMNGLDIYPLHNQPIGGSLKLAFPEGSETEYIARVAPGFEEDD